LRLARQRLEDAVAANASRHTELRGLEGAVEAAAAGAEAQRARLEAEADGHRKEEASLRAEVERVRAERAEAEARRTALRDEAKRAREEKVSRCNLIAERVSCSTQQVLNAARAGRCGKGCQDTACGSGATSQAARWSRRKGSSTGLSMDTKLKLWCHNTR
jgi:hypothetical protein